MLLGGISHRGFHVRPIVGEPEIVVQDGPRRGLEHVGFDAQRLNDIERVLDAAVVFDDAVVPGASVAAREAHAISVINVEGQKLIGIVLLWVRSELQA